MFIGMTWMLSRVTPSRKFALWWERDVLRFTDF